MFRSIAAPALAALMTFAAVSEADAWTRSGSFTGPRGTSNWGSSRSCAGGSCSWSGGGSGPRGAWSRSGSANCGGGSCNVSSQGSGPRGRSYDYTRSVSR
ncbi:hypothetical protein A1351_04355 [Methylosinus sp. R-45379]|uniref:hypothetical protein n=1 Tax=unclassified Methylosinus TaxID=2624500 RepID=UPI0004BCB2E3|nr:MULTISPECIES: hypothetical protein [unclassified Methylosinus]OAI31696.1 hypothetical protein A1351_04355 [Methylosinus sp. R-45379]